MMPVAQVRMSMAALLLGASLLSPMTFAAVTDSLTSTEEADLLFMREEEKLARDTYLTLYEQWELAVLSNIASSEQMHMNAILKLLKKYDLEDPAADTEIGEFSDEYLQQLYNTLITKGMLSALDALEGKSGRRAMAVRTLLTAIAANESW